VNPEPLSLLEATYRAESRALFARLVRVLNDFDVAEDALQDAVRAAAIQWPEQGIPENPAAWLFQTAKFRGISSLRKKSRLVPLLDVEPIAPADAGDDLLSLIFTCCHPAVSPDAQVALTLREVCELTTEEIAAAYLTPVPTIAQRIVRAKAKIREASIPFEVPGQDELPARLPAVLKTIYLVFNEGYSSSSGQNLVRADLMSLALHLGRQVVELLPEPEASGLLALMLVHQARSGTRSNPDGEIILLEDQDRTLWDRNAIAEAGGLIASALRSGGYGSYTLQAAIAAVHAEAPSYAETDWSEIIGLYDLLLRLEASPVAALNRAVAIAMQHGPKAGIREIDELLAAGLLVGYHRVFAARGELFRRHGDIASARADYETALTLARQEPERQLIRKRLAEIPNNVSPTMSNCRWLA
jgi:RNA polymerase sigma-70 factor (ECF subfamily)